MSPVPASSHSRRCDILRTVSGGYRNFLVRRVREGGCEVSAPGLRREFIKTVVRGAAALFVAAPRGRGGVEPSARTYIGGGDPGYYGNTLNAAPTLTPEIQSLFDQQNSIHTEPYRYKRAAAEPDFDLLNLGSVSPSWRAIKTLERERERLSFTEAIQQKINALFRNPLHEIGQAIKREVMR